MSTSTADEDETAECNAQVDAFTCNLLRSDIFGLTTSQPSIAKKRQVRPTMSKGSMWVISSTFHCSHLDFHNL